MAIRDLFKSFMGNDRKGRSRERHARHVAQQTADAMARQNQDAMLQADNEAVDLREAERKSRRRHHQTPVEQADNDLALRTHRAAVAASLANTQANALGRMAMR